MGRDGPPTVLQAPTNIAGQAWQYAQGLRECGAQARVLIIGEPGGFRYPSDDVVRLPRSRSGAWLVRGREVVRAAARYDVLHFHFGQLLTSRPAEAAIYRRLGRKPVMHYWGSDVRLASVLSEGNPWIAELAPLLEDERIVRGRLERLGRALPTAIVSDIELERYVAPYHARVARIPQAVDLPVLTGDGPGTEHAGVCTVAHLPSRRGIKGTRHVIEAVDELHRRGRRFRFDLIEGVPNAEAQRRVAAADIVVDQLLLGTHGIAALEAMALAKPVIGYVRPDLRGDYPADLPIVDADPHRLLAVLDELLADPDRRATLGHAGRRYVGRRHGRRGVAEQLLRLYGEL